MPKFILLITKKGDAELEKTVFTEDVNYEGDCEFIGTKGQCIDRKKEMVDNEELDDNEECRIFELVEVRQ
jgi:hypothetical protein